MIDDNFSLPSQPAQQPQLSIDPPKENEGIIDEVSKGNERTIQQVKPEEAPSAIEAKKENAMEQKLGIPPNFSSPDHHLVTWVGGQDDQIAEEQEKKEPIQQHQEQQEKDYVMIRTHLILADGEENPENDRIHYSKEMVTIPYDPELYPGIDYPNEEIQIPQEGHIIAGTKTLNEFSQQVLDNMVHLIQVENKSHTPYHQLRRDLNRATFYLEEKGNKRLLFVNSPSADSPSAGSTEAASEVEGEEKMDLRSTMDPKDQAVFNLEDFVGNPALARAIGSTLHQTLFTFLPDLMSHKEIVGLPRPSSASEQGTQAKLEYTLEKKEESGGSKPIFVITATSTADVGSFVFKDPNDGELSTFIFADLPQGRSLNFKQRASVAITLEIKPNEQFHPEQPWTRENFPCHITCLGYINIYRSDLFESSDEKTGEISSSQKIFDRSTKLATDLSGKVSSVSHAPAEEAAATFQSMGEEAS